MLIDIVCETHSLTKDNESGSATGWPDWELSAVRRYLASELAGRRDEDSIAARFSSDWTESRNRSRSRGGCL